MQCVSLQILVDSQRGQWQQLLQSWQPLAHLPGVLLQQLLDKLCWRQVQQAIKALLPDLLEGLLQAHSHQ